MSSDEINSKTSESDTGARHSPMATQPSAMEEAGSRVSLTVDENDEEEIHFQTHTNQTQRIYCMRLQSEDSGPSSSRSNSGSRSPSKFGKNSQEDRSSKSIFSLRYLWPKSGDNKVMSPRGSRHQKQHRFLEVTDPKLDHIVSQNHPKAITSEDDLIAQTLKKEAYRVANAHIQRYENDNGSIVGCTGSSGRGSSQIFYEEDGRASINHHSPINPIFYKSDRGTRYTPHTNSENKESKSKLKMVDDKIWNTDDKIRHMNAESVGSGTGSSSSVSNSWCYTDAALSS